MFRLLALDTGRKLSRRYPSRIDTNVFFGRRKCRYEGGIEGRYCELYCLTCVLPFIVRKQGIRQQDGEEGESSSSEHAVRIVSRKYREIYLQAQSLEKLDYSV
jgi:hypothetical protein